MVREKTFVTLSDNDEQRLTIYDVPQEETDKLIGGARKAFAQISAITVPICIALIVLFFVLKNPWWRLLILIGIAADAFMFVVNVNLYRRNVNDFRLRCHYIKVALIEKLPVDTAILKQTKRRKETADFYPARAKDLNRSYTTTIYLQKAEYDTFEPGKIMTIYVGLKKDMKKKRGR